MHTHNMSIAVPSPCDLTTALKLYLSYDTKYMCVLRWRDEDKVRALCIHIPDIIGNEDIIMNAMIHSVQELKKEENREKTLDIGIFTKMVSDKVADEVEKKFTQYLKKRGINVELIDI